jgi:subtilisin
VTPSILASMMRRWNIWLAALTLIAILSAGETPTRAQADTLDIGLMSAAEQSDMLQVIVTLETNRGGIGPMSEARAQSQVVAIATQQAEVVNHLVGENARIRHEYKYVPQIAMQVDAAALQRLQNTPGVARVQQDMEVELALSTSVPIINGDDIRNLGFGGAGWAVAIIDSGVQNDHPWFENRVVAEACFNSTSPFVSTTRCPNGQEVMVGTGAANDDCAECGHGTHVAGIAAGNDPSGVHIGVAPDANIIAINVFSSNTNGTLRAYESDLNAALQHVYDLRNTHNIAAVNMSLGGTLFNTYCDTASTKHYVDLLRSVGIATIVSTGNNSSSTSIAFPSCISSVVAVGNTQDNDTVRASSNVNYMLDLYAPGTSIVSSYPNSNITTRTGTSMSAPHVAGAWAVLKQLDSSADVSTILNTLTQTGVPIADRGVVKPRVDLLAAVQDLRPMTAPTNLQANNIRLTSAQLFWNDPNVYEDTYHLYIDGNFVSDLGANTTQTTLDNLSCGVLYVVQIIAKYDTTQRVSAPVNVQTASCAIDVDGDGSVTPADAAYVAARIGSSDPDANLNTDAQVTQADLDLVIENLGQTP